MFYDMTHCFKNICNNCATEPSQTLEFVNPISKITYQATWKDLITIYKEECDSTIKQTKLSYQALHRTKAKNPISM